MMHTNDRLAVETACRRLMSIVDIVEEAERATARLKQRRSVHLAAALKTYRCALCLTLREMETRVGVSFAHLNDIEHGRRYSPKVAQWLLENPPA